MKKKWEKPQILHLSGKINSGSLMSFVEYAISKAPGCIKGPPLNTVGTSTVGGTGCS